MALFAVLTAVPGHVRDPARCQALVLSRAREGRQCTAKATTTRDGQPCCARHKKARWFFVWSPTNLLEGEDRVRYRRRLMEKMWADLGLPSDDGETSPVRLVTPPADESK